MLIGCPKEIKNQEYRVGLTPSNVADYIGNGHKVIMKKALAKVLVFLTKNINKVNILCKYEKI